MQDVIERPEIPGQERRTEWVICCARTLINLPHRHANNRRSAASCAVMHYPLCSLCVADRS
jgi:hypothetical protein